MVLKKSISHTKAPASNPIGDFFNKLGGDIKKSSDKTNNEIKTTFTSDKAMAGYKTATNIAVGVASLTPLGKAAAMGAIAISDAATGGKATAYLGAQNSTLSMAPGGYLAGAILKEVDPHAAAELNKYDPKRAVMHDAKTIGTAAVTHPSSTLSVTKSVTSNQIHSVQSVQSKPSISTAFSPPATSTIHSMTVTPVKPKPSVMSAMIPSMMHPPSVPIKSTIPHIASIPAAPAPTTNTSTLTPTTEVPVASVQSAVVPKVSIMSAMAPAIIPAAPVVLEATKPTSTLQAPSTITSVAPVISVPSPASSLNMMIPIAGGALVVLFLLMKR